MTNSTQAVVAPVAFRSWEELSELEQLAGEYSDAHKDAYGFRPRGQANWTVEDYKAALPGVYDDVRQSIADEQARQAESVVQFEAKVQKLIAMGAGNRQTALRWMANEGQAVGDLSKWTLEELEFDNDLPWCYLRQPA